MHFSPRSIDDREDAAYVFCTILTERIAKAQKCKAILTFAKEFVFFSFSIFCIWWALVALAALLNPFTVN